MQPTETTDPNLVPALVARVYEEAPVQLRGRLLEQLIKPLGLLSLLAVCNGAFAKATMAADFARFTIRPEDAQSIQTSEVIALVNYVEQVSVQAIDGLAQVLATSPMLASSAAAAMLVALLTRQAQAREATTACPGQGGVPETKIRQPGSD